MLGKIYNELAYARYLIKNGLTEYRAKDVTIICKYYKSLGWGNKAISSFVLDKCKKEIPGFNINILYRSFLAAVRRGCDEKKNPPLVVRPLRVTQNELDWFVSLDYPEVETKILFSWYVLCKIKTGEYKEYLNFYGAYAQFKRDANIPSNTNINAKIRQFVFDGIIDITNNHILKINYLKDPPAGGEMFFLYDFNNMGYWYEIHTKPTVKCEICGEPILKTGNRRKYCVNCAREQKIIQTSAARRKKVAVENRKPGSDLAD